MLCLSGLAKPFSFFYAVVCASGLVEQAELLDELADQVTCRGGCSMDADVYI
jgi:hypothetical protein